MNPNNTTSSLTILTPQWHGWYSTSYIREINHSLSPLSVWLSFISLLPLLWITEPSLC